MATREDAVVANAALHQQRTALALLILADNDAEEEKLADSIFAEYIAEHNSAIAPGRGHMDPGYRAKEGDAPPLVNHGLLDSFLIDNARRMSTLGLTLGERNRLSHLFDAAIRARNRKKADSLRASESIANAYPTQRNPKTRGGLCSVVKVSNAG